ncbi:MAG: IS3 family transposase [Planctomycetaceae bacterium]
MPETASGGGRRRFTFEFKQSAVRLVMQEGLSLAEAARRLGVRESLLRNWRRSIKLSDSPAQAGGLEAEVLRLRAENERLRMEREILKKATAFLREGVAMRYAFIEEHRQQWPIAVVCEVLGVSRSGFYAWRRRPPSAQAQRREALTQEIRAVHQQPHQDTYGAPRVHQELMARGHACNRKTVAKCMRIAGIRARTVQKFRVRTTDSNHPYPIAANLLDRNFSPSEKNQVWVADITYIPTAVGWLYLAVVEDLFSRKIVGWSMSARIDSRLVVDALEMAIQRELPGVGLLAHSDRGVQYASEHYQRHLDNHGITCSMSRKANCWDNAPMESFFATLKKELVHHEDYQTHEQARQSLFEYIEVFYNRVRLHSALGYRSPLQAEQAA